MSFGPGRNYAAEIRKLQSELAELREQLADEKQHIEEFKGLYETSKAQRREIIELRERCAEYEAAILKYGIKLRFEKPHPFLNDKGLSKLRGRSTVHVIVDDAEKLLAKYKGDKK